MSSPGLDRCCGLPFRRRSEPSSLGGFAERLCRIAVVATLAAALAWGAGSQATAADTDADAEQPLREAAIAYAEAFNSNDMEALASQWAEQAELFEADQQLVGRDAIMAAIAASRARLPKAQMTIEIDDIHFIAASLARVSGRLTMEAVKDGPRISSEFTSLRVLEDGQWLLAESIVLTAPQASLGDVSWMAGTWEGSSVAGEPISISISRELGGQAVISRITVGPADEPLLTAIDLIYADAITGRLRSWTFDSTGSRAEGVLMTDGTSFNRVVEGIPAAGSGASESRWVQVIAPLGDGRLAMQSIERSVDGEPIPDTDVIILEKTTSSSEIIRF